MNVTELAISRPLLLAALRRAARRDCGGYQAHPGAARGGLADLTSPSPVDAELASLRQRAALQPCPTPGPGSPRPAGPLAGVAVPCLGAPGAADLGAALAGRPALLNVWASWCVPCRLEIPVLAQYAALPDAVAVVGIDVQDRPADALTLLADLGARYGHHHHRRMIPPPVTPVHRP